MDKRLIKAGRNGTTDRRVQITYKPGDVEMAIYAELTGFHHLD